MDYDYMNIYYPEYLMHYGVKGMKWGHRKSQAVVDARSAYKSAKKDYNKSYNSAYGYSSRHAVSQFVGKKQKAESDKRWADAGDKARALDKAKQDYKQAKKADKAATQKAMKDSIKSYNKKFNEAEKASNIADEKWTKVSEQYKALGKTRITRIINAAKNQSDAAKQYNRSYDDWERSQNSADKKWNDAKEEYKKTGKNRVSRVVNNIRYDG